MKLKQGGVLIYDSSPRLDEVNAGHEVKLEKAQDLLNSKGVRAFGMPMGKMAKEELGLYVVRNTIAVGIVAHLIGLDDDLILKRFAQRFGEGTRTYESNVKALAMAMPSMNKAAPKTAVPAVPPVACPRCKSGKTVIAGLSIGRRPRRE